MDSKSFGRHNLIRDLATLHFKENAHGDRISAESWVSFVIYPETPIQVETAKLTELLEPTNRIGQGSEWYKRLPTELSTEMFHRKPKPSATPRRFLGKTRLSETEEEITHILRIEPSGEIEVISSLPNFYIQEGRKSFSFTNIVGYLWQIIYLTQAIYNNYGYYGRASILLNLVNTRDTFLVDYASGWASYPGLNYFPSSHPKSSEPNIQIKRNISLFGASDRDIEKTVRDVAQELGDYYGSTQISEVTSTPETRLR